MASTTLSTFPFPSELKDRVSHPYNSRQT